MLYMRFFQIRSGKAAAQIGIFYRAAETGEKGGVSVFIIFIQRIFLFKKVISGDERAGDPGLQQRLITGRMIILAVAADRGSIPSRPAFCRNSGPGPKSNRIDVS